MGAKSQVVTLTIGRLARLAGVNLATIRYYEREGLLPRPPRTRSGYRIFPDDTTRRLRFIKRAQQLGFSLAEIRELLALRLKPGTTRDQIRAHAENTIADVDRKIRRLASMGQALAQLAGECSGCGPITECPILRSLDHGAEDAWSHAAASGIHVLPASDRRRHVEVKALGNVWNMTTATHSIEIFSAGCAICQETIEMVTRLAGPGHKIQVHDIQHEDIAARATTLGVRSLPAVVVNGKLAECCAGRGPTEHLLREALR